ncbi:MAG: DEAD/DEAH box helicase, partial [Woeseiaceae bacterium]|nr:DEAD/DEAH box helicase [Woeseiaceae bacterium]
MLDMLAASGAVVWVGRGAAGARGGRHARYQREHVRDQLEFDETYAAPTDLHAAILDYLGTNGASFLMEIDDHAGSVEGKPTSKEVRAAIWDLVWAGQITNDTFGPLRDLTRRTPRRRSRQRASGEFLAGGRWSLVSGLVAKQAEPTRRAVAKAKLLLDRYGVVGRRCAQAEEIPGGFGPLYKVYRELEEQGRVRRGYFVDGLEGAQFAYAGAIDRLRASREAAEERDRPVTLDDITVLAAMDPANPYGAITPWPAVTNPEQARPKRVSGAYVMLARGKPVLYVARRGKALITFADTIRAEDGAIEAAIEMLRHLPRGTARGLLVIEKIDGVNVADSGLLAQFRNAGYATDYRGLIDVQPPGVSGARPAAG